MFWLCCLAPGKYINFNFIHRIITHFIAKDKIDIEMNLQDMVRYSPQMTLSIVNSHEHHLITPRESNKLIYSSALESSSCLGLS